MTILKAIVAMLGGLRATALAGFAIIAMVSCSIQRGAAHGADAKLTAHLAADAQAEVVAQRDARRREYESAVANAKAASDFEKAKQNAQASADILVGDLRAGNRRLREQWRGCQADIVSNAAAAASERDAAEQRRRESAGRIVRAAAECDAQVASLQSIVIADRKTMQRADQ